MSKTRDIQESNKIEKNIQPIEPEKSQIVYMMPQQDFEEDEIDLFQLLLPPLRYKLQILIFLIMGILIGVGYLWYKATIDSAAEIEAKTESYKLEIKNLQEQKQFAREDFFSAIERIKGEDPVLQIVGAQYRFSNKDAPEEVRKIEIKSYQEMTNIGVARPGDAKDQFEVILHIKRFKINELMSELKALYDRYFSLQDKLAELEYQKKVNMALTFLHLEEKQKLLADKGANIGKIEQEIAEHRKEFLAFEDRKKEVFVELTDLNHEIEYIHKTLSENVYFETVQSKIPWEVWNDIKAQTKNGEKQEQGAIKAMAGKVVSFNAEINKFNLMDYIYENQLKIPLDAFDWPALKAISETKTEKQKVYPTMGIGKRKILVISFLIALFVGIISAYIRAFVKNAGEKGTFKNQKQELLENLKSWEL